MCENYQCVKIKYKFRCMVTPLLNSHIRKSKLMKMFKHSLLLSWNSCISCKHRLSWAWPLFHIRQLTSPLWQKCTLADASLFISWEPHNILRKKTFRHNYIARKEQIQETNEKCLFWNPHTNYWLRKPLFWISFLLSRKILGDPPNLFSKTCKSQAFLCFNKRLMVVSYWVKKSIFYIGIFT